MNTATPTARQRPRLPLIFIGLAFLLPMIAAGVLVFAGWQPSVAGEGQPITPQRNLIAEHVEVRLDNGQAWAWRDSKPRLTLVALAGPDCAANCMRALTHLAEARLMLNQNQSRLRLLYVGQTPADADTSGMRNYWQLGQDVGGGLAAWRPLEPDSVNALLVESNGTALSLYPAGMDAASVLRDLRKVIR